MSEYEVAQPILNSPFEEPAEHWHLAEGEEPERRKGRRPAGYFYRDPRAPVLDGQHAARGDWKELDLVNLIRRRLGEWRAQGWPGATRTTLELLQYWRRDGRQHRLFFAQLEAVETVIFLTEARKDLRQEIEVPSDEPGDDRQAEGFKALRRFGCKMATGSGKTTVMAMLAAWSVLNKVNDRSDARFSDVVLVVCPNVTIRSRLGELDPRHGEASLYRTRDIVPGHLMPQLSQGRVLITNWHAFQRQEPQTGGVSARVSRTGVPVPTRQTITIGPKTTTARGTRYLTQADLDRQVAAGLLTVLAEDRDKQGNLRKVEIATVRHIESETAFVNRVLGREVGGKQNVLVLNDEAHHAYRIRQQEEEPDEEDLFGEEDDAEEFFREATVWIDGLDVINRQRGINFCVDLSATPYFLGRVGGADANRTFPWVVSDFGLTDAIESGLVKIPQLAVRDTTGAEIPGFFNLWHWVMKQLTPAERGGKRANPKPEAIIKWAHHPIAMLGGLWELLRHEWERAKDDPRPPVFIIVCKNTTLARVVYEWLAEGESPEGVPDAHLEGLRNRDGETNTIRVDSKVVHETDTGEPKSDEAAWMRVTLDTVGKTEWPRDPIGRPIYPEAFEALAEKLVRPKHPPGRDVRCIVSVGMLTEGWDCNTVTHIIGLRPFMSQLLCEQVVGRGLRRASYEVGPDGRLTEEVAKILGVPFEIVPYKHSGGALDLQRPKRNHVHAVPQRAHLEIRFPRVEGYQQAIRNRITVDWTRVAPLRLDPFHIPPDIDMKAGLLTNKGRPSLTGPGKLEHVSLSPFRKAHRLQGLVFEIARDLTRSYLAQPTCEAPAHALFPQIVRIVERYLETMVQPVAPAETIDVMLSPYYGWAIERLTEAIRPDTDRGEIPETPRFERNRPAGSTGDVDLWTSREVRPVLRSHVNQVVADTKAWEQQAAFVLDRHELVEAFVKNAGLNFTIPYLNNGEPHDYVPDFIVRLKTEPPLHLILETKGYDPLKEVKTAAAHRWAAAVNADGRYGRWAYAVAGEVGAVDGLIQATVAEASPGG